jgi:hypothetical protein
MTRTRWGLLVAALLLATPAAAKIDRHALVTRHNVTLTKVDPHAPLMLGNGNLGFTADITGLQTFPEQYAPAAPLLTMAQWAWHSFPNPRNYSERDGLMAIPVRGRGTQPYPWIRDWSELDSRPALRWLRENPHRFSLGRISLLLARADGSPAAFADLAATSQKLDLWTGALVSRFTFDGQPVTVETRVAAGTDTVLVQVRSPLVARGRVGVELRFPGVSRKLNPDPQDWAREDLHVTRVAYRRPSLMEIQRTLDTTGYHATIATDGKIDQSAMHRFRIAATKGDRLTVQVGFGRNVPVAALPYADAVKAVATRWRNYWTQGGAVDFSGSADPRARELERRVVLSQYLAAINQAGEFPPQEEGLFSNSWNGKFHLEMHALHAAHWGAWGRPEPLRRNLGWYINNLRNAQQTARTHRVEGAWWPKMSGPEGRNSPSTVNPFIMWQQPNPIYMAELLYRAAPDPATLDRYGNIVEQTAALLGSWPFPDVPGKRYVLGPPIIPVQENHAPLTTVNPAFELEYFRWGLITAQKWRERRGMARNPEWDRVIAGLPTPAEREGLYLPVESAPDFWRDARSDRCRGNAVAAPCLNRDHPSMLMAWGLIGGRIDQETMRRTLRAVEETWDMRQTWGWDYPVVAMTAARLGEPEKAIEWLFRDLPNNRWGISGMTPRVHLETERQMVGPAGAAAGPGPDGPGYARAAETYFPSNGSLLLAVAMMAAGWDGSTGAAPGFPKTGWKVRVEGVKPLP